MTEKTPTNEVKHVEFTRSQFADLVSITAACTDKKDARPTLRYVKITHDKNDSFVTVYATDSYVLCRMTLDVQGVDDGSFEVLVHAERLESVLGEAKRDLSPVVNLSVDNEKISFTLFDDGYLATDRLADISYPDIVKLIPKKWEGVTLDGATLGFDPVMLSRCVKVAPWNDRKIKTQVAKLVHCQSNQRPFALIGTKPGLETLWFQMPVRVS